MSNIVPSKTAALAAVERYKGKIASARKETEAITGRALTLGASAAGGAAAAVLKKKAPLVPGTEIDSTVALAGAAGLAGIVGMAGKYSDPLCAFAGGMLAVKTAEMVEKQVQ